MVDGQGRGWMMVTVITSHPTSAQDQPRRWRWVKTEGQ